MFTNEETLEHEFVEDSDENAAEETGDNSSPVADSGGSDNVEEEPEPVKKVVKKIVKRAPKKNTT